MNKKEVRKMTEEEALDPFEKILLMCGQISMRANDVNTVYMNRLQTAHLIENGGLGEEQKKTAVTHKKLADGTIELLKEVSQELYKIYEDLTDFCNNCDYVSDTSIQLGEPVYNAMNDLVIDVD